MPPIEAWRTVVLERYAKFDGRAGRAEYWWFTLAQFVIYLVLLFLMQVTAFFLVIYILFALATIIPSIAVAIRRLHDTNKTGWLLLLGLVPFVGGIILLVFMILAGDRQSNQYGPVPASVPAT